MDLIGLMSKNVIVSVNRLFLMKERDYDLYQKVKKFKVMTNFINKMFVHRLLSCIECHLLFFYSLGYNNRPLY